MNKNKNLTESNVVFNMESILTMNDSHLSCVEKTVFRWYDSFMPKWNEMSPLYLKRSMSY